MSTNKKSINYRNPSIGLEGRATARRHSIAVATSGKVGVDFDADGAVDSGVDPRKPDEIAAAKRAIRRATK